MLRSRLHRDHLPFASSLFSSTTSFKDHYKKQLRRDQEFPPDFAEQASKVVEGTAPSWMPAFRKRDAPAPTRHQLIRPRRMPAEPITSAGTLPRIVAGPGRGRPSRDEHDAPRAHGGFTNHDHPSHLRRTFDDDHKSPKPSDRSDTLFPPVPRGSTQFPRFSHSTPGASTRALHASVWPSNVEPDGCGRGQRDACPLHPCGWMTGRTPPLCSFRHTVGDKCVSGRAPRGREARIELSHSSEFIAPLRWSQAGHRRKISNDSSTTDIGTKDAAPRMVRSLRPTRFSKLVSHSDEGYLVNIPCSSPQPHLRTLTVPPSPGSLARAHPARQSHTGPPRPPPSKMPSGSIGDHYEIDLTQPAIL